MTKREKEMLISAYISYRNSKERGTNAIHKAYTKPSLKKIDIFNKLVRSYAQEYDHIDCAITSHNGYVFCLAIMCEKDNDFTFYYETPNHTYSCTWLHGDLIDSETGEVFYES